MDMQKSKLGLAVLPRVAEHDASSEPEAPESYQTQLRARSELQRPAAGEVFAGADNEGNHTVPMAIPAWLRSQVEQLAQRRGVVRAVPKATESTGAQKRG